MSVAVAKVAISIDSQLLKRLDAFIQKEKFERMRLAEECAKLDPVVEQSMAEEW